MDTVQLPSEPVLSPNIPPAENTQKSNWVSPLLVLLGVAVVMVLATLGIFLFVGRKYQPPVANSSVPTVAPKVAASINGQINFEGYIPAGSYISIAERGSNHDQFKEVVTGLLPKSGVTNWSWTGATSGTNYDIKALLKIQGKEIQESPIENVSAPATNVALTMVSQQTPPTLVTTSVSGQINLDGYAPTGSTLQVLAKTSDAVAFQPVASNITPVDNASWTWSQAQVGKTYDMKSQLVSANGTVISTGDTQTVTAPSSGLLLNVASTANPPAPTMVGISGTITINGNIPSGAYITLATRPSGTATFNQVASNITATSGVSFSWANANEGQQYDVQAYLWSNGKPYAASNILSITAPSTFDILTINAQQPTSAPSSGTLNVSCGNTSGGLVQATINFNTNANLPNAASYNIVVTSATQSNQVVNTIVNPPNPTQSQSITTTYVFQPGATYYAQYAYATSNGGQMSALSPSVQFACQ